MIDIHTHILHGIDDGAKDMNESVNMAILAYEDGIRHIYATSHFNAVWHDNKDIIEQKVLELQHVLDQLGIDVMIYPGNEVSIFTTSFFYEHAKRDSFCYLDKSKRFILLEQPWKGYNTDSVEIVKWLCDRGTIPIIAHPERHGFFRDEPDLLYRLLDEGAWTQVSVDSLIGKNNADAQLFSYKLMQQNLIHTIASDAHNVQRKPHLSAGYQLISETMGPLRADEIKQRIRTFILD